jgi:glucose/arabinose dehydrogenase
MKSALSVPVYLRALVVVTSVSLFLAPAPAAGQLRLVEYAGGFSRPLGMVQDPADPSVQYVLEKFGVVWALKNGVRQPEPFIDLASVVMEDGNGERGLLGLAFPSDAASSGRAFLLFSSRNGRGDTVVARFTRMPGNPLQLDPASRFDLEFAPGQRYISQPDDIHKAGKMLFGPDGYLYIGVGDGGPIWDPHGNGQATNVLLGKILRIDVNVPDSDSTGYVIPPDNPFVATPGARPEIWAVGLRNPWRFTVDDPTRGGTGALLIADVGQDDWEEVNYQPAGVGGRNYGWSLREGAHDADRPDDDDDSVPVTAAVTPLTDPIYEYPHGPAFGNSITGGYVYRGFDLAPSFQGRYFFTEFIFRRLYSMPLTLHSVTGEAAPVDPAEVTNHTEEVGGQNEIGRTASIDVDARGELYLVDHGGGRLLKLVMDSDGDNLPDGWEARFGLNRLSGVGPDGAGGDVDNDGRTNAQELLADTHPSNVASLTRYLAEGSSSTFFDTTIGIANPGAQPASVLMRFLRTDGVVITWPLTIPSLQHATIRPARIAGLAAADFSTVVETDREVVVERTMTWSRDSRFGSHSERAIATPSTSWFLAEGATHGAFDTFYLIENPNDAQAKVQVTYLLPDGAAPIVLPYDVDGHTRKTIWVDAEPGLAEAEMSASISVTNDVGIIVERAMYRSSHNTPFMAGHDSAGVTAPAAHWFFAEGATGNFFDMFLLLANPGTAEAKVTVRYLLPGGVPPVVKPYTLDPRSRTTINVEIEDARLADAAVAMVVDSDLPIVAERSMYWPGPSADAWLEAHNSAGATEPGAAWTVAGGEQGGASQAQTYVLIANTSAFQGKARLTVLREGGTPLIREFDLSADSRTNVGIGDYPEFAAALNTRFGVLVESLGDTPATTAQIVVEHATYTNDATGTVWGAGSNSLATRIR